MRYRIKIITYIDGSKRYFPQEKTFFRWVNLNHHGLRTSGLYGCLYREAALGVIDKNYERNPKSQTIEFEYINKKA